jgi:hypothetical protein
VLRYGLDRSTYGAWDLHAIGVIGMVVGALGLVVSTLVWAPRRHRTLVEHDLPAERVEDITRRY